MWWYFVRTVQPQLCLNLEKKKISLINQGFLKIMHSCNPHIFSIQPENLIMGNFVCFDWNWSMIVGKALKKYLFTCNPIYRNQICRTRLCFYAPVAGPIWVRPDDVMVVIRARNALLQPIQFHRTKKTILSPLYCIVTEIRSGSMEEASTVDLTHSTSMIRDFLHQNRRWI